MDLYELLKNKEVSLSLTISSKDLILFGKTIAEQTAKAILERYEEKIYTRAEVADKFNISEATLWRWSKLGIVSIKPFVDLSI